MYIVCMRLADWTFERKAKHEKDGKDKNARNLIYGNFYDTNYNHWLVCKARRDLKAKQLFIEKKLVVDGYAVPEPSEELKEIRKKKPEEVKYSVISSVMRESIPYAIFPEASTLAFIVPETLKARLEELRQELPPPPAAKRPRIGDLGLGSLASQLPNDVPMQKLLEQFTMVRCVEHEVGDPRVSFRVYVVEKKDNQARFYYMHNKKDAR